MSLIRGRARRRSRGYTLIELVTVMVIVAILASVAGAHFFDQTTFTQRGYADEVAAALRFAQKAALTSDCVTRVNLTSGSYAVQQQAASGNTCNTADTTWATAVLGLDGTSVQGTAPSGTSASPTGLYCFAGSGLLTSVPTSACTPWAYSLTVGVNTITIDPLTGLIQEQ